MTIRTERIGNFLKKHVKDVQPTIEELIGTTLGDIGVRPLSEQTDEHVKLQKKRGFIWSKKDERLFKLYLAAQEWTLSTIAQVVKSTIYYSRSPAGLMPTGNYLWYLTAHELGHLAHHALVGEHEFFCFKNIRETFADYVAVHALKRKNIEVSQQGRIGAREFRETLAKAGMPDTMESAIKYIRANTDICRKSDGDYKIAD